MAGEIFMAWATDLLKFAADGTYIASTNTDQLADYPYAGSTQGDQMAYDGTWLYIMSTQRIYKYDPVTLEQQPENSGTSLYSPYPGHPYGYGLVALPNKHLLTKAFSEGSYLELDGLTTLAEHLDPDPTDDGPNYFGQMGVFDYQVVPPAWTENSSGAPHHGYPNRIYPFDPRTDTETYLDLEVPAEQVSGDDFTSTPLRVVPYVNGYWASWEPPSSEGSEFRITRHDLTGALQHNWSYGDINGYDPNAYPDAVEAMDCDAAGNLYTWSRYYDAPGGSSMLMRFTPGDSLSILEGDINGVSGGHGYGGGGALMCIARRFGGIAPLRQFSRDDGLRSNARRRGVSTPTSRQGSIRRGPRNNYT